MLNRQGRSILGYIRRMGVIEKRGVPIFESRLTPLVKDGTLRDDNALGARIVVLMGSAEYRQASGIVHKGDPVAHSRRRAHHGAVDIGMDKLQRIGRARCGRGEGSSVELARETRLTDRIWGSLRV